MANFDPSIHGAQHVRYVGVQNPSTQSNTGSSQKTGRVASEQLGLTVTASFIQMHIDKLAPTEESRKKGNIFSEFARSVVNIFKRGQIKEEKMVLDGIKNQLSDWNAQLDKMERNPNLFDDRFERAKAMNSHVEIKMDQGKIKNKELGEEIDKIFSKLESRAKNLEKASIENSSQNNANKTYSRDETEFGDMSLENSITSLDRYLS